MKRGNSSAGRAQPCQGWGREFESRFPLQFLNPGMPTDLKRPAVLCFSGHDPSGGAGIQADIETIISHHCHPCSIITALTEQDTHNAKAIYPQSVPEFIRQTETLLADIEISAIKIGLLGSTDIAIALSHILNQLPTIPVILDPVLAAGGGKDFSDPQLIETIIHKLLPLCTVITPNSHEARLLTNLNDLKSCGEKLQQHDAEFVLITGAHEQSQTVDNLLFGPDNRHEVFHWERLTSEYHGSGCTLTSSIAALIAHNLDPFTAISEAQEYTWNSLAGAYRTGHGQLNPNRLFWTEE